MPVSRSICNPASSTDGNVYARMTHSAMSISNVNRQQPHPESLVIIVLMYDVNPAPKANLSEIQLVRLR